MQRNISLKRWPYWEEAHKRTFNFNRRNKRKKGIIQNDSRFVCRSAGWLAGCPGENRFPDGRWVEKAKYIEAFNIDNNYCSRWPRLLSNAPRSCWTANGFLMRIGIRHLSHKLIWNRRMHLQTTTESNSERMIGRWYDVLSSPLLQLSLLLRRSILVRWIARIKRQMNWNPSKLAPITPSWAEISFRSHIFPV